MYSPIRDQVVKAGDLSVAFVAFEFKMRKGGRNSAGISVFWGDDHSCNISTTLRGDKLTSSYAQLAGQYFYGYIKEVVCYDTFVHFMMLALSRVLHAARDSQLH